MAKRIRSTPLFAIAALLIVGLAAAGCGSSSSSSSSTSTTAAITKAAFLKQGNAICKKGNQEINAEGKKVFSKTKKPTQAQMTQFATATLIPHIQAEISGIKALGAPKGDEAQVNAMVASAQSALDQGKKNPTLLVSNNSNLFKHTNQLTNAYGLTVCGGGGGG
jgi:hypothetical protein